MWPSNRRVHLDGYRAGPHGLGWIAENATIKVLGNMGMLYIMFQAGVEIDMNTFRSIATTRWCSVCIPLLFLFYWVS